MTLALTQLSIRNFRSYGAAEIQADARPVAIFGSNGAGKTNLLEAISLLSPGRGLRRAVAADLGHRRSAAWRLSVVLDANGRLHEVETGSVEGTSRQVRIDGKAAPQSALARIARILWLVPSMDRLWIEGAEGRRRFLDRMTLSLEPSHAAVAQTYDRALRERNRLLRDSVGDNKWYEALERQMAAAGSVVMKNRAETLQRLLTVQNEGRTAFPAADLYLSGPDGKDALYNLAEPDDMVSVLARSREVDLRAGRSLVGPHRSDLKVTYRDKGVPAALCSTGEQKALLISLVLSNARALAEDIGTPPILLLDEVSAHLDADRRASLFDEICGLGAQAWMTGTGPELFEALGDRARWLRVDETPEGSRAVFE